MIDLTASRQKFASFAGHLDGQSLLEVDYSSGRRRENEEKNSKQCTNLGSNGILRNQSDLEAAARLTLRCDKIRLEQVHETHINCK